MSLFHAIGISSTGITVNRKWMDAVSDNLANINNAVHPDEEPFRARYVEATAVDYANQLPPLQGSVGGGVMVSGIELGPEEGLLVYEPENPVADDRGYVRYPDISMVSQMSQLMMSQRAYQANLAVVERAKAAYEGAIGLGSNT